MKAKGKGILIAAFALAVMLSFAACGGGFSDPIKNKNEVYAEYTALTEKNFGEGVTPTVASYSSLVKLEKEGKYAVYDVISDATSGFDYASVDLNSYGGRGKAVLATKVDADDNVLYGLITMKGVEVLPFTKDEITHDQRLGDADLYEVAGIVYSVKNGVKKQLFDLNTNRLAFKDASKIIFLDENYFIVANGNQITSYNMKGKRLASMMFKSNEKYRYLGGGNALLITETELPFDVEKYDYYDTEEDAKINQKLERLDIKTGKRTTLKIDGIVVDTATLADEGLYLKESYEDRVRLDIMKLDKTKMFTGLEKRTVAVLDKKGNIDIKYSAFMPYRFLANGRYLAEDVNNLSQKAITDGKGKVITAVDYAGVSTAGSALLVTNSDSEYALFDKNGKQLFEFGEYDNIFVNWDGKMIGYVYNDEADAGKEYTVYKIAEDGTGTQVLQSAYAPVSAGTHFYVTDTAENKYVFYNFDGKELGKVDYSINMDTQNRVTSDEANLKRYTLKTIGGKWYRFA